MNLNSTNPRRRRWGRSIALLAAASAIGVGATAVGFTFAASNSDPALLVPTSPCRLVDTRGAAAGKAQFAAHSGKLGANTTITVASHGTNGDCTIPATATALSLNVTSVGADSAGMYLTLFPAGATLPTTSNLNPDPKSSVTVNAATVQVSTTGAFSVYNFTGSTHLLVDVLGYYIPSSGSTGPAGPAGPAGAPGSAAPAQQLFFPDGDGDGEGNPYIAVGSIRLATTAPAGYVANSLDCADDDPAINSAAVEVDDSVDYGFYIDTGLDENCDGQVLATLAIDSDGDFVGSLVASGQVTLTQYSAPPAGFSTNPSDCDDTDATIYPGAPDAPGDGIDQNCDGDPDS